MHRSAQATLLRIVPALAALMLLVTTEQAQSQAVPFGDSLGIRGTRSNMAARPARRCIDGKQVGCPIGLARPAVSTALGARA
jgi:fermentation-respiration switch protein FrsA (DUF1100 family)